MLVTCGFSELDRALGGESPPATLTTFPLVTGLQGVLGAFPALVVNYVTPGQRAFSDEVELGESNPRSQIGVVADQKLCGQVSGGFRVTVSDR